MLGKSPRPLKLIICHLGTGGSSLAAVKNGESIDTSMGYTPLTGLVMSTRSGDIDPMLTLYLIAQFGLRPEALLNSLSEKSGLLGLAGFSSDLRDIMERKLNSGEEKSSLAFKMYIHRLKKYIGSYVVALKGLDALVFTDDIGLTNCKVRQDVCDGLDVFGIKIDREANKKASKSGESIISAKGSKVKIISMPTKEELVIAQEGLKLLKK